MRKVLFVIVLLVSVVGLYGRERIYEADHGKTRIYKSSEGFALEWDAFDLIDTYYGSLTIAKVTEGDDAGETAMVVFLGSEVHPRSPRRSDNKYIEFRHWEKGFITDIRIRAEDGMLDLLDIGTIFIKDAERALDYILDTPEDEVFYITTEDRRADLLGATWRMEDGIEALDKFMDMTTKY